MTRNYRSLKSELTAEALAAMEADEAARAGGTDADDLEEEILRLRGALRAGSVCLECEHTNPEGSTLLLRVWFRARSAGGELSAVPTHAEPSTRAAPEPEVVVLDSESPVLEARGLSRSYGSVLAVDGVDFRLGEGEFLTIFGPNGAGEIVSARDARRGHAPDVRSVTIRGEPLAYDEVAWRARVGILSHQGYLYGRLTVEENLAFYGKLFGLTDLERRIGEHLARVDLSDRSGTEVRTLSHGMRQRLALGACAPARPRRGAVGRTVHGPGPVRRCGPSGGAREPPRREANGRDGHAQPPSGPRARDKNRDPGAWPLRVDRDGGGDVPPGAGAPVPRRGRGAVMSRYLTQLRVIVWKDLLLELRTRERLAAMGAFAVLSGVLFSFAIDTTLVRPQDVAAGLIWMTIVFGGLLGVGRTFQIEAEDRAMLGILTSPTPKDAVFLAKTVSNFILLFVPR